MSKALAYVRILSLKNVGLQLAQKRKSSELQQLLDMSSKKSRPLAEKISKHGKSDGQVGGKGQ